MRPVIHEIQDLEAFVRERRQRRSVTPSRKPLRRTLKGLSIAWGVPEKLILSVLEARHKKALDQAAPVPVTSEES